MWCKKYSLELKEDELKSHHCLTKFSYLNRDCVCPCLLDRVNGTPIYEALQPIKECEEFWSKRDRQYKDLLKAIAKIQKVGIFNV